MERRLLRAIINPAMIATWVLGLWLAYDGGYFKSGWLHGKLLLVLILSALHGLLSRWVREFAADRNAHSQKFYRDRQRGAGRPDDRNRDSGYRQAILITG